MFEAIIASAVVALVSVTGIFIFRNKGYMTGAHRFILPVAVGVFLGIVFLELVPETLAMSSSGALAILGGFLGFYLLSHLLSTFHHHHHDDDTCSKDGARMLLWGDAVHNAADGVVIATAFLVNPALGIITTIGVILHELPQEIAEFGVLVQAGYSKRRAAMLNLLSASSVVVGTAVTLFFSSVMGDYVWILTGIAAGNLLYIATSDFIPELREKHRAHFYQTFLMTILGVAFIAVTLQFSHAFMDAYGIEDDHAYEEAHHEHDEDHD